MKWRVMLEFVGPDGTVGVHEVEGRAAVAEYAPRLIGLTLAEGKHLAGTNQLAFWIAVGTPITGRPPHRTVRAVFPHTAPTLGV
jgi:hypothetical protein